MSNTIVWEQKQLKNLLAEITSLDFYNKMSPTDFPLYHTVFAAEIDRETILCS